MSGDLISRRSVLNKINEWSSKLSCENSRQFALAEFEHMLAIEPTAYDADKVIEQLEENAKFFQSEADELAQNGDWGTATDLQGRAAAYRDAAEIVKSGGVSNGN